MAIEITKDADEHKPRVVCPHCKEHMMADITQYANFADKPVKSNCPYCNGEVWSCCVIIAHKDLRQLGATLNIMIQAVEGSVNLLNPDSSKTLLIGDN